MMYKDVWEIDYKIVPQKYLEEAIDKLIDASERETDQRDNIKAMIREVRKELVRRL